MAHTVLYDTRIDILSKKFWSLLFWDAVYMYAVYTKTIISTHV